MAGQQTLTPEEMSLLITLKAITDFNKDNPGNIPEGGISEVIVSNDLFEADELKGLYKSLSEKALIHGDYVLTSTGEQVITEFEEALEQAAKNKKSFKYLNYTKEFLEKVCTKLKDIAKKIDWVKVINGANLIVNISMLIENIIHH